MHGHGHASADISGSAGRWLTAAAIALGVLTVAGFLFIGFESTPEPTQSGALASKVYEAEVVDVEIGPCAGTQPEDNVECRKVTFRLTAGPDEGEERLQEFPIGPNTRLELQVGDRAVLSYQAGADEPNDYSYADRQRRRVLFVLLIAFAIAVIVLGRWHGVGALVGLGLSLVVILRFILPAVLAGRSPVLVAVIGSAAIAFVALYLANGFSHLTTVALLGTIGALVAIVLLSMLVTAVAHFSGFASDETAILDLFSGKVDVQGLILAGIVLGSLGALDDVTVTQASVVAELHEANPEMDHDELFRSGMRIGRDHVASTVNTLALAYAGAALPTMLLFVLSQQSLGSVANSEIVAVEIVRTLVGSIGIVLSVPLTTWLAARVVRAGAVAQGGDS